MTVAPSPSVTDTSPAGAPHASSPSGPCGCRRPARASASRDLLAGELLLAREQPALALDQRDARAEGRVGLAHLHADHAAAHDHQAARGSPWPSSRRGSSTAPPRAGRRSAGSPASCRRRGSPRGAPRSSPRPRRRASPRRAGPSRGAGRCRAPRARAAGRESSRSWMISSRRSSTALDVELAGDAPRRRRGSAAPRRAPRPGAAAPSTACTPRRSTRRRPCGPRRSPRRGRRRRAGPPPPRRRARRRAPPRRSSPCRCSLVVAPPAAPSARRGVSRGLGPASRPRSAGGPDPVAAWPRPTSTTRWWSWPACPGPGSRR